LKGTEAPDDIDSNSELIKRCDAIASVASDKINTFTMLSFVAPPADYINYTNDSSVKQKNIDFLTRMIFLGRMHKTYAASQITCCGTAACIPGTVVNEVAQTMSSGNTLVRMGHPAGTAELEINLEEKNGRIQIPRIIVSRTARRLLEGYAFVKK